MSAVFRRGLERHGQLFSFSLCRKKKVQLGPVQVEQWWMPITRLYGQRNGGDSENRTSILRLYQHVVVNALDYIDIDTRQRLLLASLVPHVRGHGSRRIFADAFFRRCKPHRQAAEELEQLNLCLDSNRDQEMDPASFEERSWQCLGHRHLPEEGQRHYNDIQRQLLSAPSMLMARYNFNDAFALVRRNWDSMTRAIGRRAGNETQKLVLDVLSYEARAAFHACYSVAWNFLLQGIAEERRFDDASLTFHRFWHLDPINTDIDQSVFHGHVFALHPALGPFIKTATGQQLLGQWILDPQNESKYRQLLNGICLALYPYSVARFEPRPSREHRPLLVEPVTYDDEIEENQQDDEDSSSPHWRDAT